MHHHFDKDLLPALRLLDRPPPDADGSTEEFPLVLILVYRPRRGAYLAERDMELGMDDLVTDDGPEGSARARKEDRCAREGIANIPNVRRNVSGRHTAALYLGEAKSELVVVVERALGYREV